ncbi:hypothetical protein K492DRAFT_197451 [Lichtheimia hyalospora FSU 10163]|nr:hypothetical protein K492DRAFT_197451 [Lichtheimia hyalospora FSU 10163]
MSHETASISNMVLDIIDDSKTKDVELLAEQTKIKAGKQRRRRTRSRVSDPNHVPRPSNCFMLYRLEMQKYIRKHCPYANHREISKIVAKWWHEETDEIKDEFRSAANKVKLEHRNKYPDYKYSPKKKKQPQQQLKQQDAVPQFHQEGSVVESLASFNNTAHILDLVPWQQQHTTTLYDDEQQEPTLYMPESQYYILSPETALPSIQLPSLDYAPTNTSASLNTPVWEAKALIYDGYNLSMTKDPSSLFNKSTGPSSSSSSSSPSSSLPDIWHLGNNPLTSCDSEAYPGDDNMQSILNHEPIIDPWHHSFVPVGESLLVEPLHSEYSTTSNTNA